MANTISHHSRNMTGIYLGLEGNSHPPLQRNVMPPLSRAKGNSASAQTPTEQRRSKMIDMLRIKEETKGFRGKALKKQTSESDAVGTNGQARPPEKRLVHHTDVIALIKMNARHYTAIHSAGVTRYENLMCGDRAFDVTPEFHDRFQGHHFFNDLREKGDDSTLFTTLPQSPRRVKAVEYTGFSVKSYQNPSQARILADFPLLRPGTVPSLRYGPQSRYTHSYSSLSGARVPSSGGGINKVFLSTAGTPYTSLQTITTPAQPVSAKRHHRTYTSRVSTGKKPPVTFISPQITYQQTHTTDCQSSESSMNGGCIERKPMVINMKKGEAEEGGMPPASPTMFVVEDEDGVMKKIEFEESTVQMDDQSSHLQRQESEEIMAVMKENAEQRQKKFAKLLDEHKEIVQEIGRISSSDCIVTQTARD